MAVSLGGEVRPASSAIPSSLPAATKSTKAAEKVRSIAASRVDGAWTTLVNEAQTQKLVWDSLVHTSAKNRKGEIESMQARLDQLIAAIQSKDEGQALALTEQLIEAATAGTGESILGMATLKAARDVLKQLGLVRRRQELAFRLDSASIPATLPRTAEDKQALEAELVACELEDANLEKRARQALLLPLPPGQESAASKEFFTPVYVTGSRKLGDLFSTATPARPVGSGAAAGVTVSGAPVTAKKSSSLRGCSTGAVTGPTPSNRSNMAEVLDSGTAAQRLREFADSMAQEAWSHLQKEFEVVQLVWESISLTKVKPQDKTKFADETGQVWGQLEDVMRTKDADMEKALTAVAAVLPPGGKANDVLSSAMVDAIKQVLEQHRLRQLRHELAERLATAHVAATLPRGATEKKAMEEFVVSCELSEPSLARAARSLLLLPLPAGLGPAVSAKLSSRTAVSGKRSSSSGGVVRKGSNKPTGSAPPASVPVRAPFMPPSRMAAVKESI